MKMLITLMNLNFNQSTVCVLPCCIMLEDISVKGSGLGTCIMLEDVCQKNPGKLTWD